MTASVLSNGLLLLDDRDLTGRTNAIGIDYGAESQDETSLDDDTRIAKGGLKTVGLSAEGFFDGPYDADIYGSIGVASSLITMAATKSVGDVAYTIQALTGNYTPIQGSVGDIVGFSLNAKARGALQRVRSKCKSHAVASCGSG